MRNLLLGLVLTLGCGGGDQPSMNDGGQDGGRAGDAGSADSGRALDSGGVDGGAMSDGGSTSDAGSAQDGGTLLDAGPAWATCRAYLADGGSPGDPCDPSTFGSCSNGTGCCDTFTCDSSTHRVVDTPPACAGPCLLPVHMDCPGFVPPPPTATTCHSEADCSGPRLERCAGPGDPAPPCCGICMPGMHDCVTSADCAPGNVCQTVDVTCSCDGPSEVCVPDCRDGRGCTGGMICDASTGVCRGPNCTDGVTCPASATCAPSAPGADDSGCVRRPCTIDAECDCGACVDGTCHDGVGTCEAVLLCD